MTLPDNWWLWFTLAVLALPLIALTIRYTRARRRRSLANIYGAGFYLSIKQPRYRENMRRHDVGG